MIFKEEIKMGEILKRTDEYRVETEADAKQFIEEAKQKAREGGYEIASYSATHKVKKDDDYYVIKVSMVW